MALDKGRGEISGPEAIGLKVALSLEPNVEKHVPTLMGHRKQLCALLDDDRLRTLRDGLTIDRIDWKGAGLSSQRTKDAFRLLASPVDVRVLLYPRRSSVRLSFPEEVSNAGLLDQSVVVVVFGRFVEFWNPNDWRAFLETTVEMQEPAPGIIESLIEE